MADVVYTPKSITHVDFGWLDAYTDATDSLAKRDILIRVIHLSNKEASVFEDSQGNIHRGMFVNYDFLSKRLKVSRRTAQTIVTNLVDEGYLIKHQLKNNHILVEASDKALILSEEIHEFSLAAKAHPDEYEKIAKQFEIVYVSPAERQAEQIFPSLQNTDDKLGKICLAPYKEERVNKKITVNNNQYQVLETATEFENSDCLTVIFYFDEFGLDEIPAESDLFDYFTVAQSQVLSTITYCYAEVLDITVFNETLARQDLRAKAQSFTQLVNWAYSAAVGDQQQATAQGQTTQPMSNEVTITLDEEKETPNRNTIDLTEAIKVCDADNQGVKTQYNTTQTSGSNVMAYHNTTNFHHDKTNFNNQPYQQVNSIPESIDLDMPLIEKEVLRKDWASLADQAFYDAVLPDSQKIALVAIIDYVKRKGAVFGSDAEIYKWLYHTVSNHQHYYSRATNFKHLANILMKQLMNKRFERPSGYNAWEQRLQQEGRGMSRLQRE